MNLNSQVEKGSRDVHNPFHCVDICAGALSQVFIISVNPQTIIMMLLLLSVIIGKQPCLDSVIVEFRLHLFGDLLMDAGKMAKGRGCQKQMN